MRPALALLLAFAFLSPLVPAPATPTAQAGPQRTLEFAGTVRHYELVPPAGPRPAPAIVVLHGGGADGLRMRRIAHFTLAGRGWAEVYPDARGGHWNDGRRDARGRLLAESDDVGFLRALVEHLAADGIVDPRQVYFAGISNGGGMVLRLLCEKPELVAGAAVVAMNLREGHGCPDSPPVPVLLIHGTADPIVPFAGGRILVMGRDRGRVIGAEDTAAFLAWRNRCGPWEEIAITDHDPADGTRVRLRSYRGCAEPLLHYIIEGGGHTWPGNRNRRWVERFLGPTSRDISATFEIEAFFTSLARR